MRQLFFFVMLGAGLAVAVHFFTPQLQQAAFQNQNGMVQTVVSEAFHEGQKTYGQYCAHCHESPIEQGSTAQMSLAFYDADLPTLQKILTHGRGDMPEFDGMFSVSEISNLHNYLKNARLVTPR